MARRYEDQHYLSVLRVSFLRLNKANVINQKEYLLMFLNTLNISS